MGIAGRYQRTTSDICSFTAGIQAGFIRIKKTIRLALILNIDTATEAGSVCLAKDGIILGSKINTHQKDHAAVIAPFIQELLQENKVESAQIEAVAISGGPGSYTGLKVAASTAKGLCYAWNVPLIAINTLKIMANGMAAETYGLAIRQHMELFCPMIDARRMEVFTALYDADLHPLVQPAAIILEEDFLKEYRHKPVLIFGSGMRKAEKLFGGITDWDFEGFSNDAEFMVSLSEQAFEEKQFQDLAYFEPWYLKAFHKNFTHS